MCKISIVMPVYNGAEFLEKSIESISKQTLKDVELICVNDGSTDNSLEVLNELKNRYPFIKIITQENQGSGAARNNGIKNATGEYVAFLDADDEFYDDDSLERMYDANTSTNADMVAANLLLINNDDTIADNFFYNMNDYRFFADEEIIEPGEYGAPLSFYKNMFKREFLIKNNIVFPDFRRGQDPPFLAKILTSIDKIQGVPVNFYGHHFRVGGGAEAKIDTYEKKRGYIEHFKVACDILSEGGLKDLSDFYKIHLFRYMSRDEIINDDEAYDIFDELFGIENPTFDRTDINYGRFIVPATFHYINKYDDEEFYLRSYKNFLKINIYNTRAVTEDILDKYFLVVYSRSYDDFKNNCQKFQNNNLEFKKELMEFEVNKFKINLDISDSELVFENAKTLISNSPIWLSDSITKNLVKRCYKVIKYDSIMEFKESYW